MVGVQLKTSNGSFLTLKGGFCKVEIHFLRTKAFIKDACISQHVLRNEINKYIKTEIVSKVKNCTSINCPNKCIRRFDVNYISNWRDI